MHSESAPVAIDPAIKARIDSMDRVAMCKHYRFSEMSNELFYGEAGTYFMARFKELGGFSPEISKQIGWKA